MKNVVVLGGGTGTYTVLSALRDRKDLLLTALITMLDDGGSNKVLRDEFGLLPTSGVRLAMVALSTKPSLLRELFLYRFHQGTGISGMTFGNLFLAALSDIVGSQEEAIEQTCELLSVKGNILPISYEDVRLVAQYENGLEVIGEHAIDDPEHDGALRITKLFTRPTATISDKAREAILTADAIIMGPGDLYTNTIANLVIEGVPEAIQKSAAHVIFVENLMTEDGETHSYTALDHLKDVATYLPMERINTILINNDTSFPTEILEKYRTEHSVPVVDDLTENVLPQGVTIIRTPLLLAKEIEQQKGDSMRRSMIRHDPKKLGKILHQIITNL
jgi:uncharacterized cofD-like protein